MFCDGMLAKICSCPSQLGFGTVAGMPKSMARVPVTPDNVESFTLVSSRYPLGMTEKAKLPCVRLVVSVGVPLVSVQSEVASNPRTSAFVTADAVSPTSSPPGRLEEHAAPARIKKNAEPHAARRFTHRCFVIGVSLRRAPTRG